MPRENTRWNKSLTLASVRFRHDTVMDQSMVGYRPRKVVNFPPPIVPAKLDPVDRCTYARTHARVQALTKKWYMPFDKINYLTCSTIATVSTVMSPSMLNPMRRPVLGIYSDEGVGFERGGALLDGGYGWVGSPLHTSPYPPTDENP